MSGVMPMPVSRTENFNFTRPGTSLLQPDADYGLAPFGELNRIVNEVDEDLSQTKRVTNQIGRDIRLGRNKEFEILLVSLLHDDSGEIFQDVLEAEVGISISSLPASIFEKSRMSLMIRAAHRAGASNLRQVVALFRLRSSSARGASCR